MHTDDRDAGQRGRVRDEPHRADLDCECLGLMDAARGVGVFRLVSCVSTRCADAVTPRVSEDMDGPNSTAGAAAVNAPAWATVELATYKPDLRATITETLKRKERTGRRLLSADDVQVRGGGGAAERLHASFRHHASAEVS